MLRWRLRLSEYEYEIKYKPGRINSNADGLCRLLPHQETSTINTTNVSELNYQNFIKYHYTNQEVITFEKEEKPLAKIRSPLIIFWSQDLDESNQFSDFIKSHFNLNDVNPTINECIRLNNINQTIYLLFGTNCHFDKLEYKDIFQCLLNFRKTIKNNDFIFALPERHKNIKSNQLYEMFKYSSSISV
ncbi:hypothetical protein QE152_g9311 [Popillia japonica]|uniref:Uncharacterized protein n=1 Tax=Popillia japonica TaxID=7064 RepID=A0AAW1LV44_POPJA